MYISRDKGGAGRFPSRHYKRVALCARIVSSSCLHGARKTGTAITTFVGGACLKNTTAKELSIIASTMPITRMNGPPGTSRWFSFAVAR